MKTIDIQLRGIDEVKDNKKNYVHMYGTRTYDAADRLVGIAISMKEAAEILEEVKATDRFPIVEVQDNQWFHVAVLPPSLFDKGAM